MLCLLRGILLEKGRMPARQRVRVCDTWDFELERQKSKEGLNSAGLGLRVWGLGFRVAGLGLINLWRPVRESRSLLSSTFFADWPAAGR